MAGTIHLWLRISPWSHSSTSSAESPPPVACMPPYVANGQHPGRELLYD
jgi:hypothetical protein